MNQKKTKFLNDNYEQITDFAFKYKEEIGYILVIVASDFNSYSPQFIKGDFNSDQYSYRYPKEGLEESPKVNFTQAFFTYVCYKWEADKTEDKFKDLWLGADLSDEDTNNIEEGWIEDPFKPL